jgi:hypothetical protein
MKIIKIQRQDNPNVICYVIDSGVPIIQKKNPAGIKLQYFCQYGQKKKPTKEQS